MKPILEILAGIPTVVYGYFAALTVAPAIRDFAVTIGLPGATSESALAAGAVMGNVIGSAFTLVAIDAEDPCLPGGCGSRKQGNGGEEPKDFPAHDALLSHSGKRSSA